MRYLTIASLAILIGCAAPAVRVPTNEAVPGLSAAEVADFRALTPLVADARRGSATVQPRILAIAVINVGNQNNQSGRGNRAPTLSASNPAVAAEAQRLTTLLNRRVESINRNEAIIACNERQTFPAIQGVTFVWETIPQIASDLSGGWTSCRDLREN
jgi:hypothetical protein